MLACASRQVPDMNGHRPESKTVGYHRTMLVLRIALVAALWVVAGCSAASSSGSGTGSPRPSGEGASLVPASARPSRLPDATTSGSPGPFELPASIVDPVVAEVAHLAGVPADQVVVKSAESLTFPDGGLGCPLPGMVYTQVQVEGFKIIAEVSGKTYDFRGTGPTAFRQCTTPRS
jgi:hypothetical protein